MRNLTEVIEELKKSSESLSLNKQLDDIIYSLTFCAPELTGFWWREVANLLEYEIGEPKEEWHFKMVKIFAGKPEGDA